MANVSNPVGNKFIDSLARPGGNVTGIATLYETLLPKIAETLHALVPSASRVAVLVNENNPSTSAFWQSVETALRTLGKTPIRMNAFTEPQIVEAFEQMRATRIQATIVVADNTFVTFRDRIAALAHAARIPAAYALREHVAAGGLVSYGPSLSDNFRASARYVAQILKGVKPADLPVVQPTKFELVVNRKTAESLGLKIPPEVLLRADEVIE
jgi:putative ABC transport system substrate-binding protein